MVKLICSKWLKCTNKECPAKVAHVARHGCCDGPKCYYESNIGRKVKCRKLTKEEEILIYY